ncbi:MAG: hypothetical protein V4538_02350 [Bacteroidota bacterium]
MAENNKNTHSGILILLLLLFSIAGGYLAGYKLANSSNANTSDTLSHTKSIELQYDSVPKYIDRPYPVTRVDSYPVIIPIYIDTQAIIKQWFTGYIAIDSSTLNNELFLLIADTIEQNQIKGRHITYKILRADSIIKETTVLKEPAGNAFFVGAAIGTQTFAPGIMYNRKNKYIIGISSNLLLPQPSISGSIYFKIK